MDNIVFYSDQVYLSENSNPDSYIAKFIICDFGRNKNGVALDRNTIENWMSTLKNKPLVGKIKMRYDGEYDFTGHNVREVEKVDENGNKYREVEFDTEAFGTFFDVAIETINDKEYIVASCEIWKRFTKACEIIVNRIQEGSLSTSWEISVEKSTQGIIDGLMTKIIQAGRFIGHCLLGKNVSPAYDSSGLLEIASTNYDMEFAEALSQDILSQGLDKENEAKEENNLQSNIETQVAEENVEETVVETPVADTTESSTETEVTENKDETEVSQLTEYDLRKKICEACRAKLDKWCWISFHFPVEKEVWLEVDGRESELDFVRMTYTVENDTITVSDPEEVKLTVSIADVNTKIAELEAEVSTKDDAIIKSGEEIARLKTEISELSPFKEKFEKAEQERIENELKEKKETIISSITKSGLITREEIETSEELKGYVENLDEKSLKAVLADRYIASLSENNTEVSETKTEVETETASTNLDGLEDEQLDVKSIMKSYFK